MVETDINDYPVYKTGFYMILANQDLHNGKMCHGLPKQLKLSAICTAKVTILKTTDLMNI